MLIENIKLALSSIRANKMRSFLTMLGMIIGISSVIAIVSLGDTMRGLMASEYENIGTGLAYSYIMSDDGYYTDDMFFYDDDVESIEEAFGDELTYVGYNYGARGEISVNRKTEQVNFSGLGKNPTAMEDPKIIHGRMLNDADFEGKKASVVIDKELAKTIYGVENVVGKQFTSMLDQTAVDFTIVGVYENTDSALMKLMSGNQATAAYFPYSAVIDGGSGQWTFYYISAENVDATLMQQRMQAYIARLKNLSKDNVRVYTAAEEMQTIDTMLGSLSLVVGAIAAISLVVGGIGIMNIMLVSVTERTREIGIRKALGAKTKDILIQFLIEAAAISAAGGVIGTILGISLVGIGGMIVGLGVIVKPTVVVVAVAFSAGVGLVFGLYPARKAARKDPVEALRYE